MKAQLILIALLLIASVAAEECLREMNPSMVPCAIISSWKPSTCSGNISVYNSSGANIQNLTWGDYHPFCNATWSIDEIGVFHYNSSIENGVITIKGEDENMILGVLAFLFIINLVVFLLPFFTRFSTSKAASYVVRRMFWIAAVFLLWFNMTLVRQLSSDWGLGIDQFLVAYWWMFTLASFACVLVLVYVSTVGGMKLVQEARMRKRMGDDD